MGRDSAGNSIPSTPAAARGSLGMPWALRALVDPDVVKAVKDADTGILAAPICPDSKLPRPPYGVFPPTPHGSSVRPCGDIHTPLPKERTPASGRRANKSGSKN